jgi:hypothetical protein
MLEVDTYSDLDECREMARKMVVLLNEGDRIMSRDEANDLNGKFVEGYVCIPFTD